MAKNLRLPPLPTQERARLTEELILSRGTDTSRWSRPESLATQWDARAAMAASWIPAQSRVLDVGAGAMALEAFLQAGCTYQPADVVARRDGCFVVDLNRRQFPPGSYDCVTFLGVLEYVHEVDWPLARAREAAPQMILTYCTHVGAEVLTRRGMGWVNDLTAAELEAVLARSGWTVDRRHEVKRGPTNIQLMYGCSSAGKP
jgi:hypothetical protein